MRTYLGDGVYIEFNESRQIYQIWVDHSGGQYIRNKIYLEPEVMEALVKFKARVEAPPYASEAAIIAAEDMLYKATFALDAAKEAKRLNPEQMSGDL